MEEDSKQLGISKITTKSFSIPSPLYIIKGEFHSYLIDGGRL
jgi:hypothetical protein